MCEENPTLIKPDTAEGRETSGGGYITFFYQKDNFVCGTFTMPPGITLSAKGAMSHPGDEIYYVVKGPSYCDLPDEGRTVRIESGEGLTLPAGTKHIPHNKPGKEEVVVFFVCTEWP
jgi:mannose-6-phosphate isomerase-like protein (cupin superfamily)